MSSSLPLAAALLSMMIDVSRCGSTISGFAFHSSSSSSLFSIRSQQTARQIIFPRSSTYLSSTSATDGDVVDASTEATIIGDGIISTEIEESDADNPAEIMEIAQHTLSAVASSEVDHDDAYFDKLFDTLAKNPHKHPERGSSNKKDEISDAAMDGNEFALVDFIEQTVGIQSPEDKDGDEKKKIRGRDKPKVKDIVTSAFSVQGKMEVIKVKGDIKGEEEESRRGAKGFASEDGDEVCDQRTPPSNKEVEVTSSSNEFTMASEIAFAFPSSIDMHNNNPQEKIESFETTTTAAAIMEEQPPPSVNEKKEAPYNVVCTHITADFDTLASAIGLAKLWSLGIYNEDIDEGEKDNPVNGPLPTYVVLPRGAHPDVQRFLSLHKHLFPIRSLKSLPGFSDNDLKKGNNNGKSNNNDNPNEGLQRVGLVDAQRRDRLGPADVLLPHAKLGVTIVDHHVDAESDIKETRNYVIENVGSVSTMIAERIKKSNVGITEAEATILALGIHSDTGSLVYDSTTPKDASMLGWTLRMGASQTAIAEHAKPTLSDEQQGVLTQSLININSTTVHGVTISTVLLSADGFIPGLASVTKDALDLSSSDVFLLAVCYEATRSKGGGRAGGAGGGRKSNSKKEGEPKLSKDANDRLQKAKLKTVKAMTSPESDQSVQEIPQLLPVTSGGLSAGQHMINSDSWKGGEVAFRRQRLAATFAFYDTDRSGFLDKDEIAQALTAAGFVISPENFDALISSIDTNGDGKIDFEEFVYFYTDMEEQRKWDALRAEMEGNLPTTPSTMTIIGRVKAGVNVRNVNLNTLFQKFSGGGHPKAASCTVKLEDESEAKEVLQGLVNELIDASLEQQLTVGDFMQSPVLSAKPTMTEKQVEDLFIRYDVRALPVVNDDNEVIGLVSYKEVAAAKMRLMNKQEKRIRQIEKAAAQGKELPEARPMESPLKGWMKQHVQTVEASLTMAEVENVLLETDVGCIPVVVDGTKQLIGMVTRTDLLRQHRYYNSLHYHNKGFSDSIAARKPIIELRKKLKKFDIENE